MVGKGGCARLSLAMLAGVSGLACVGTAAEVTIKSRSLVSIPSCSGMSCTVRPSVNRLIAVQPSGVGVAVIFLVVPAAFPSLLQEVEVAGDNLVVERVGRGRRRRRRSEIQKKREKKGSPCVTRRTCAKSKCCSIRTLVVGADAGRWCCSVRVLSSFASAAGI